MSVLGFCTTEPSSFRNERSLRMKKIPLLILCLVITAGFFGFCCVNQIQQDYAGIYRGAIHLPTFFPSENVLIAVQIILLALVGIAVWFILERQINPNRKKNVLINTLILLGLIFCWNFLMFNTGNLTGALVLVIAGIILGLIVLSMAWLVDHRAGYLMIPINVWIVYLIILNISLTVLN